MKTENEIQNVINWLGKEDADDPCNDLPYIENVRAFKEALLWILKPSATLTNAIHSDGEDRCSCQEHQGGSCAFCMETKYNL